MSCGVLFSGGTFKDRWFEEGDVKALEKWLQTHDVDYQNEYGNTVAHWASWHNQLMMLKCAQRHGANLDMQNNGVSDETGFACAYGGVTMECTHRACSSLTLLCTLLYGGTRLTA